MIQAIVKWADAVCRDADPTRAKVMVTYASIPNQPRGACDVDPGSLTPQCAIRASKPPSFARNVTLEHTLWTDAGDFDLRHGGKALHW